MGWKQEPEVSMHAGRGEKSERISELIELVKAFFFRLGKVLNMGDWRVRSVHDRFETKHIAAC